MTEPPPRPAIPTGLASGGIVAIARRLTADTAPQVANALVAGGVLAFEITLNEPVDAALRSIAARTRRK